MKRTVEKITDQMLRLEARITVLEDAVQCAAGNHVWEMRVKYTAYRDKIYIGCKHCGAPKDLDESA